MCCSSLERRSHFHARLIPSMILFIIFPEILPDRYNWSALVIGEWFTLSYPIMVALLVAILCLCYKIQIAEAFNYVAAAYSVQHIIFNACPLLKRGLLLMEISPFVHSLFRIAVECAVWVLFYFLFVRRIKENSKIDRNKLSRIVFSGITILVVYAVSLWTRKSGQMNLASMAYSILCCVFLLVIQFHIFEKSKLQQEQEITKYLLQLSQKQYELSRENINIINVKCHDLKHQLGKLKHISSEEERARYIAETQKAILIYDAFVKTGNKALDSVITEKSLLCESKGIRLCSIIDGDAIAFMENADIYALFGNALDNAIASVEGETEDKRIITLNVIRQGAIVRIHMDNYCGSKLVFQDGLPATTNDDDGYHGFGCKSIKMIAEKYNGQVEMRKEDDRFCLDVLLFPKTKTE